MKITFEGSSVTTNENIREEVKKFMVRHAWGYDNPTSLAEAAADEFELYHDEVDYEIPEWVFEEALEHKPVD